MKKFNPYEKPPFICPKEYCFNWEKTSYSTEPYCTARECRRIDPKARLDALESNHQKMWEDGLPWFYFTQPDCIVDANKENYRRDSEKYWGKDAGKHSEW